MSKFDEIFMKKPLKSFTILERKNDCYVAIPQPEGISSNKGNEIKS